MVAIDRISSSHASSLLGALLLALGSACTPDVTLGEYGDTDGGSGSEGGETSGSSGEAQCEGNCDPDFAVVVVQGLNADWEPIDHLAIPLCEDEDCPNVPPEGFSIPACRDRAEAMASALGREEYCRFAAGGLVDRLGFVFSSALERGSFEVVRPDPQNEAVDQAYFWFADVVEVAGPGTAYRGRYIEDGRFGSVFNEACAERLSATGAPPTEAEIEAACLGTWNDGGVTRPLRMRPAMTFHPVEGELSTTQGNSCATPDAGPDTCCSACDLALGPHIARYGVDGSGQRRSSDAGTAIACGLSEDPLVACRDLVFDVTRGDAATFEYAWGGETQSWPLPLPDKLRETHPDDRPAGLVPAGVDCEENLECPSGQACYGTLPDGSACSQGSQCTDRTCQPEWFGTCEDVAGDSACVDRRFDDRGAGACFTSANDPSWRLSNCDSNEDGALAPFECCIESLGGAPGCDPLDQPGIVPVAHYDREPGLSSVAACVCEDGQEGSCAEAVVAWCEPPIGEGTEPGPASPAGGFAVPLLQRLGGVRIGETANALELKLANIGDLGRAQAETCAESRGRVGARSAADGWTAWSYVTPELREDHDLAMCSGSTYTLTFARSDAPHQVRSDQGGVLDGRATFVLETAQFRVVPGSAFPTDNLRIGSCDALSLRLTNVPDLGPLNLGKLALHEGAADGPRVAGGEGCSPDATAEEVAAGTIPCLDVGYVAPDLSFGVDESIHGQVLVPGTTYVVVFPALDDVAQLADPDLYAAAFHDACGMPLIASPAAEASFTIDESCS